MYEFFINFGTGLSFLGFRHQAYRTIVNRNALKDIFPAHHGIYSVCLSFSIYAYLNAIWFNMAIDLIQLPCSLATITFILRADRLRKAAEQRGHPE